MFRNSKKSIDPHTARAMNDIDRQLLALNAESEFATKADDMTPPEFHGHKRRYHYKAVQPVVFWQFGGNYNQSCESIGMRRGDPVQLTSPQVPTGYPQDLAINWNGIDVGLMKGNRLRDMVYQWRAAGLPVLAAVSFVGGESKLLIEYAFYGFVPKK